MVGKGALHRADRGSSVFLQEPSAVLSQSYCLLQVGSSVSKPGEGLHVKTRTNISLKWDGN